VWEQKRHCFHRSHVYKLFGSSPANMLIFIIQCSDKELIGHWIIKAFEKDHCSDAHRFKMMLSRITQYTRHVSFIKYQTQLASDFGVGMSYQSASQRHNRLRIAKRNQRVKLGQTNVRRVACGARSRFRSLFLVTRESPSVVHIVSPLSPITPLAFLVFMRLCKPPPLIC
jgi:hypothetical protein